MMRNILRSTQQPSSLIDYTDNQQRLWKGIYVVVDFIDFENESDHWVVNNQMKD